MLKTHMRMIKMTGRTKEVTKKPTWKPVRLYPARSKAQITELPEDQKWVCYDNDVDDNDSGGGNDDDRDVGHHTEVEYCHKGFSTQFGEDSAGDHSGPNRSK